MENIVLVSGVAVSNDEVRELVTTMGGEPGQHERHVIQRGSAIIFIDYYDTNLLKSEYEPEELVKLLSLIGGAIGTAVSIHRSSDLGSLELQNEFALSFLQRWGGVVDTNFGGFLTRDRLGAV